MNNFNIQLFKNISGNKGMLMAVSLHDMSAKDFARFLPELHMLAENLEIYKRQFKRHNRKTTIKW